MFQTTDQKATVYRHGTSGFAAIDRGQPSLIFFAFVHLSDFPTGQLHLLLRYVSFYRDLNVRKWNGLQYKGL
jgi:hypothetical protein